MPRKEKKYHFIYKTTNLLSGKYYIGMHSTNNLEDGYLGSGKRLRYSINKYGAENHKREIIEFVDSRKELAIKETEIVNLNEIAKEECMNLRVGGEGGVYSLEAARKGGLITNERYPGKMKELGSKGGTATFDKYGINKKFIEQRCDWTGREHSEESINKMKECKIGHGVGSENSQFGTCWINNTNINKKIKKEDLEFFINEGWVKGRKIK